MLRYLSTADRVSWRRVADTDAVGRATSRQLAFFLLWEVEPEFEVETRRGKWVITSGEECSQSYSQFYIGARKTREVVELTQQGRR